MMKSKINFKEYEPVDILDDEEKELWESLQSGSYESILTDETKAYYAMIFKKPSRPH